MGIEAIKKLAKGRIDREFGYRGGGLSGAAGEE